MSQPQSFWREAIERARQNRNAGRRTILFVDEVHRYTKSNTNDGISLYTGLNSIAREGRKKGIFLFLTTQNPNDVDKVLLG